MSLEKSLQDKKITFFVGKGGVGKTTLAVASALSLAERMDGRRVLIASTDPAHSLTDTFGLPYTQGNVVQVYGDLPIDVVQIEPKEAKDYSGAYGLLKFFKFFQDRGVPLDLDSISCAISTAIYATTLEENGYGKLIIDSEPTAGLYRLLDLPENIDKNLRRMSRNPILVEAFDLLQFISKDASQFTSKQFRKDAKTASNLLREYRDILHDPNSAGFVVVSSPEQTVLSETERLIAQLRQYNFSVDGVLFNKILERDYNAEKVRTFQFETIREFAAANTGTPVIRIPYLDAKSLDRKVLQQLGQGILISTV